MGSKQKMLDRLSDTLRQTDEYQGRLVRMAYWNFGKQLQQVVIEIRDRGDVILDVTGMRNMEIMVFVIDKLKKGVKK